MSYLFLWIQVNPAAKAHEGLHDFSKHQRHQHHSPEADVAESKAAFQLYATLLQHWPNKLNESLIAQAYAEQQFSRDEPTALGIEELRKRRKALLGKIIDLLPSVTVQWDESEAALGLTSPEVNYCESIAFPLLIRVRNGTDRPIAMGARPLAPCVVSEGDSHLNQIHVPAGSESVLVSRVLVPEGEPLEQISIRLSAGSDQERIIDVPANRIGSALIRGTLVDEETSVPGKVFVECADGVFRHAGPFAAKATLTEKPIIYPPIGLWQKMPYFYSQDTFEIRVPAGTTQLTAMRGFEHKPSIVDLDLPPGQTREIRLSSERLADMAKLGWVSGDTHVHWVTNQWNVDEPLELLSMVQRSEDVRVINNLTLLQRYGNQAFIKPSQAAMGPVPQVSDAKFHVQMGEEYRNEDLYGHLCFLNIDWLVQPIGTGAIIAGPDALDYPINRTAIDACHDQGGISIEAHGTGGNKDVPVNVIHNLADSLDQMEPDMYYRLLDCGFRLPLTNGSDHPARPLGIARAYVQVNGPFDYDGWIEGIRRGRTFTTSGPLLFLNVNEASIGDVIHAGEGQALNIQARVLSRFPIGHFQVISNGEILVERHVDGMEAEIELTIDADQSRWIVARCSSRQDGRSEFGFGNFNAITGPGVAHTSPVYVHVDGMPRYDASAAEFWAARMHQHALDIKGKGRFANETQRSEAVGYIEQGISMFRDLAKQVPAARSRSESFEETRERLQNVVRRFGDSPQCRQVIAAIQASQDALDLHEALKPITLLAASVNPESRVKIAASRQRITLKQGKPQRFLIAVENTAGITAPLAIETIDVAIDPPGAADWCELRIIDSPFTSVFLTGAKREYKVLEIFSRQSGLKETRLTANVGQGTQDLGFRATADLMIETQARRRAEEQK